MTKNNDAQNNVELENSYSLKKNDSTRTWAVALKEAASFAKEQLVTFGGKLIALPHERFEFKIEGDHTLSAIYAKESDTYKKVSEEIKTFELKITELEEEIRLLTDALKTEQSNTDAQQADKKPLLDAHAALKEAKSLLNKSKMSLWFAAFTYTVVKTPQYLYNLGNNVVNLFLRALGVVINGCSFALYAVSYIVLQLRILVAPVMKSDTKDMSEAWDKANEKTSYAAVVYAYLTHPTPKLSNEKTSEEVSSRALQDVTSSSEEVDSKKTKKNKKTLAADLTQTADEDEDLLNISGTNPAK